MILKLKMQDPGYVNIRVNQQGSENFHKNRT